MENIADITIETERLLLVPTTQEYVHEIFTEFTDEVTKYMFPNSPKDISETQARIDDVIKRREA
jgi:[ribosomal protein S5]-alanine N-acetyltransferase